MKLQKPFFVAADYAAVPSTLRRYQHFYRYGLDLQEDAASLHDPLPLTQRQQKLVLWSKMTIVKETYLRLRQAVKSGDTMLAITEDLRLNLELIPFGVYRNTSSDTENASIMLQFNAEYEALQLELFGKVLSDDDFVL